MSTTETESGLVQGHVFVVHGLMENVVHDAAIVPTSSSSSIRPYWKPILGGTRQGALPRSWTPDTAFARSDKHEHIWFVSVARLPQTDRARLLARRVAECVEAIAASGVTPQPGRVRPLVALPVVGIEGGGLGKNRGEVIRHLLNELHDRVPRLPIDVALVIRDRAVHAAAQSLRIESQPWQLASDLSDHAARLGRLARSGHLALFFGAGVSVPAGLPTWKQLLKRLAQGRVEADQLEHLSALDQAQLLAQLIPELGHEVAQITGMAARPSLAHTLLASLNCREAVTTNYDRLYERAIEATGGDVASVLPWQRLEGAGRWVLKMHGDHEKPESIVLTRGDFVRYDALTKPAGSILQALLLTRHVLVVGASLTDDNVVRLAYEVEAYRKAASLAGEYGTLIDVEGKPILGEVWKNQIHWLEMVGHDIEHRARTLEIFLDAVSAWASKDSSWLLDERFAHLLRDEADIAHELRELHRKLPGTERWRPVDELLTALGSQADGV